jgi:hypothetical protein
MFAQNLRRHASMTWRCGMGRKEKVQETARAKKMLSNLGVVLAV